MVNAICRAKKSQTKEKNVKIVTFDDLCSIKRPMPDERKKQSKRYALNIHFTHDCRVNRTKKLKK